MTRQKLTEAERKRKRKYGEHRIVAYEVELVDGSAKGHLFADALLDANAVAILSEHYKRGGTASKIDLLDKIEDTQASIPPDTTRLGNVVTIRTDYTAHVERWKQEHDGCEPLLSDDRKHFRTQKRKKTQRA